MPACSHLVIDYISAQWVEILFEEVLLFWFSYSSILEARAETILLLFWRNWSKKYCLWEILTFTKDFNPVHCGPSVNNGHHLEISAVSGSSHCSPCILLPSLARLALPSADPQPFLHFKREFSLRNCFNPQWAIREHWSSFRNFGSEWPPTVQGSQ